MSVDELKEIQEKIDNAKIKKAKAEGQLEQIEAKFQKEFGTTDIVKIEGILLEKEKESQELSERIKTLEDELKNCTDWDSL